MKSTDPYAKETGEPSQLFDQPKDTIIWIIVFGGLFSGSYLLVKIADLIFDLTYRL